MPLLVFVGIDNYGKSLIYALAYLIDETVETVHWVFE